MTLDDVMLFMQLPNRVRVRLAVTALLTVLDIIAALLLMCWADAGVTTPAMLLLLVPLAVTLIHLWLSAARDIAWIRKCLAARSATSAATGMVAAH